MAKIKIAESNDGEDLVGEYLASDPSVLSAMELKKIADVFGLSYDEVRNISKGMTALREEIREQEGVDEGVDEPALIAHGDHDQKSHGNWATGRNLEPATSRYGTDPGKIRRWAQREGRAVGARGRLSQEIVDEYDETFGPGERAIEPWEVKAAEELKKALAEGEQKAVSAAENLASAIKAVPALARYGDAITLRDSSWDPASSSHASAVSQHLADLAAIPDHFVEGFIGAGGRVIVGNGPITEIDPSLAHLRGVRPRGWPAGTSYDDVAGVYSPNTGTVVLGNIPNRANTPVSNFAFHEFAHGIDALTKKVSLLSQEDGFKKLWNEEFQDKSRGKMNQYYVQGGSEAGASEFFADSGRGWFKGINGDPELRNAVMRNSFAEAGTFVSVDTADLILKYWDELSQTYSKSAPATEGAKGRQVRKEAA